MCGIAGLLRFDQAAIERGTVKRMTDAIAHRGPDGEGMYLAGPVGLGHRRLAIIDLSPAGKQPMSNEDGTVWITFNGEIYNFTDIRQQLEKRGHYFRSLTDTEVIVHAYEEWDTECLNYLNGMFAFGIWDERKQRLWLVRDRLGVKPLFYCHLSDRLLFGSEAKAILSDGRVDRSIDYASLAYFLALNYTPAPHTLFKNIRQILPGHYLLVDANGRVQDVAYWDLTFDETDGRRRGDYLSGFTNLLEDSVRLRLVSDVPFGTFLSGGIDSSSVAYWMSRHMAEPVKTFSIGFGESSFDEVAYARKVAAQIRADYHERIVDADTAAVLPKIVWHAEEPTADSSMVAVYYLAQMAREHVTMVLSGDGADEILAGYETYQAFYLARLYQRIPAWLRNGVISPLVNILPTSDAKVSLDFKLKRFVRGVTLPAEDAHGTWRTIFDAPTRAKLLSPDLRHPEAGADALDLYRAMFARTNARHPLNRMLYVDTRFYLPNDMLVKVDRMTMAHGLEAREPFLDYRLVEFVASVPAYLKLRYFLYKKYLLKVAMSDKLPAEIIWRRKQGFNVPNARWIKQGLKPFVMDSLSPVRLKQMGIFNVRTVEEILRNHFAGQADNSHQIWCLLTLVHWWSRFIEGQTPVRAEEGREGAVP
jgi:asparagine synthase (glutamine-hydrolysing)